MRFMSLEDFEQVKESLLTSVNHPVYEDGPGDTLPQCIYFYYVTMTALQRPVISVYYYDHNRDFGEGELLIAINALAKNARLNEDVPPKCGTIFEAVHWQRKSYFVLVLDDPDLYLKAGGAVIFDVSWGHTPNHTFFDGIDFEVEVPKLSGGTEMIPALRCINYMNRNEAGDDLRIDERQHFIYNIFAKSRSRPHLVGEEVIDPGGTNLGPPVPPP